MASSSSPASSELVPHSAAAPESALSAVVFELSQQVQGAMGNMLKMISTYLFLMKLTSEIDEQSAGIMEVIDKCKEFTLERRKNLEEEKDRFQKAAYSVLDMLNNRD